MPSYLIVQRGPELGKRIALKEDVNTIGRSNDNDVELSDPYVSRYHSVIKKDGENYAIVDLGSENPVQIRDTALEPGVPFALQHRDVIRIGQYTFSYVTESGIADRLAEVAPMPEETDLFKPSQPGLAATASQSPAASSDDDANATQVFTGFKSSTPAAQSPDSQPTVAANWFTQLQAEHSKTPTEPEKPEDADKNTLDEVMPEPATAAEPDDVTQKPFFTSPAPEPKNEPLFATDATASSNKPFFTSDVPANDSSPTEPETDYKSAAQSPISYTKEPDTTVDNYGWQTGKGSSTDFRPPADEDAPTIVGSNFEDSLRQYRQQNQPPAPAASGSQSGNFFEQRTDVSAPASEMGNKPSDLPKPPTSNFNFSTPEAPSNAGSVGGGFSIPQSSPSSGNIGGGFSIPEVRNDTNVKSPFSEPSGGASGSSSGGSFGTPSFAGGNTPSSPPSFGGSNNPPNPKPLVSDIAPTTRMTPVDDDAPTILGTSYADVLKQYRQPQTPPSTSDSDLPTTQIADYSSANQSSEPPKPPTAGQGQGQGQYGAPSFAQQPQYGQPGQFSPPGQPQPPYGQPGQGQNQGNFRPNQPGQPPYGQPQPPYGQPQPPYGQPNQPPRPGQPPYGQPQPPYGQPQPPYGQPGQFPPPGQPQPPYGQPPRPGQPQPPYGQPQPPYGQPGQFPPPGQPPYSQPGQPPYGQPQPPYGQPQPPFGQPGQPPYGQPQPPYGQPGQPPRPGQPPYGQPTGQTPPYGQPYGQPSKPGDADKDKPSADDDDSPTINIDIPKR